MLRRTVAAVAMIAGACGVLLMQPLPRGAALHLGGAAVPHPGDGQHHLIDGIICHDSAGTLNGEENPEAFYPLFSCGDELTPASPATQYINTVAQKGNRLWTAVTWMDEAFARGADAAIADGTVVGGTFAKINAGCDDTPDYLADSTSTMPIDALYDPDLVPEPLREWTTAWGPGTGLGGRDESFLDDIIPPDWTRHVRYRADMDFIARGDGTSTTIANPVSLNWVVATPPWGNARASIEIVGGDDVAPSAQLALCFDSPLISRVDLNAAALLTNPATPGMYAMWTSYVTSPGTRDEQLQQAGYITSCNTVGEFLPDADNDCWPDALDDMDGTKDRDGDGLLDGIELAWLGSEPCPAGGLSPVATADCDGDGREDAEEHFSSTNPRLADTDGDGFLDSGLNLDCDGDDAADAPLYQSVGPHSGQNRVRLQVMYCTPNGQNTMMGGLGGRAWGNVGATSADNCPNHAGPQTNTSALDPDLDALPVPGDTNGRFAGTADVTHPDASFSGDICDLDDDNDGVPDAVEGTMYYDEDAVDFLLCNTSGGGVAAVTLPNVRDSDADGTIDGVECNLGKNPANPASKPGTMFTPEQQVYFRLIQMTQPSMNPLVVSLDDGSTIAGVAEARGLGPGGASQIDHDRDGCVDEVEMIDVDGNRVAGDSDRLGIARAALGVSTFAPPGSNTAEERRAADMDFNGVIGDPDRLAAARIVLTSSLPAVPDYNLNCKADTIGYEAN